MNPKDRTDRDIKYSNEARDQLVMEGWSVIGMAMLEHYWNVDRPEP
jgi:hypothetical protein